MAFESKVVTRKDGSQVTVFADPADGKNAMKDAVKAAENAEAPVYPNINHPVQKGHDLVAIDGDVNKVLVDGTGAHNSPNDAVNPFSPETDSDVKVAGLEEPAYKTVPVGDGAVAVSPEPTKAEVAAAKADSVPANETEEVEVKSDDK
jgi:hypothetical protein